MRLRSGARRCCPPPDTQRAAPLPAPAPDVHWLLSTTWRVADTQAASCPCGPNRAVRR
jgi:hypothetical protein